MKKFKFAIIIVLVISALTSCSLFVKGDADMTEVKMTATIISIGEKLEVEVTESESGVLGPFWIITGIETKVYDSNGHRVPLSSLKVGDTVEITYGGQMMMSFPPQVVAKKIQIK